ncbi:MAG: DUF885 domain-containing protein [Candidatus Heimdallarchaeota archaeon]|nr:DUF885 domain-containing protein [Candidatus Heimdallarchaeota archaeon]MDH5644763.1 DUF885 domain-containing protein [Candidatus Heimdallarchaeota archaeon]
MSFLYDTQLYKLFEEYQNQLFEGNPVFASVLGIRDYDHELPNMSKTELELRNKRDISFLMELEKLNTSNELDENIDLEIFKLHLSSNNFTFKVLKNHEWDPLLYISLIGQSLNILYDRVRQNPIERAKAIFSRLSKIPILVQQAIINLNSCPALHRMTAIDQINGLIDTIQIKISKFLEENRLFHDTITRSVINSLNVLKEHINSLSNNEIDFRTGLGLYEQGLYYVLGLTLNVETIKDRSEREKQRVYQEMVRLSKELIMENGWSVNENMSNRDLVKFAVEKIGEDRLDFDSWISYIEGILGDLTSFIKMNNNIIDLDDSKKLLVELTPDWMRGVAIAYLNPPGPYEEGKDAKYYISPPLSSWSEERIKGHVREYNREMLKILSIHEGIPGHFVQLYYHNRCKSPIRRLIRNGAFVEGWAVFTEKIMLESGYEINNKALKLQGLKFYMRTIINAIIDQGIHAYNMNEEEAVRMMIEEGFQEEAEAKGKWNRALLSRWQLSTYFVGYQVFNDLLLKYTGKLKQKELLTELLNHGSPPVYILDKILEAKYN